MHQFHDEVNINLDERVRKVKEEILTYINGRVSKSSRISEIIEQPVPFEKTATQKIKRFLYT
jgi:long-chain acyl-CoA synthetase